MLSQPYSKWAVTNVQCNLRWTCAAGRDAHTSCCLLSFAHITSSCYCATPAEQFPESLLAPGHNIL